MTSIQPQPADSAQNFGPLEGFSHEVQIEPEVAASIELEHQPAKETEQSGEIPKEMRAKKGQIAFNVLKIVGLIVTAPITAPFAACYLLGYGLESLNAASPGEFAKDMKEGWNDVMKPLSRAKDEVLGGVAGVTGKAYRTAVKDEQFWKQHNLQTTEPSKKKEPAKDSVPDTSEAFTNDSDALRREQEAAAKNLKAREFLEERSVDDRDI